jgi:hypothetical protein
MSHTIIVFQTSEYTRKNGDKGYIQQGQLVQTPKRPNAPVTLFFKTKEECLETQAEYTADLYKYEDSKNRGTFRDGWENFVKVKKA